MKFGGFFQVAHRQTLVLGGARLTNGLCSIPQAMLLVGTNPCRAAGGVQGSRHTPTPHF